MTPQAAVDLCEQSEGLRLSPYLCPSGVPTVGYGTTRYEDGRLVTLSDPTITRERADSMMRAELERCCSDVLRLCPIVSTEPPGRLAALADFAYNLGAGRLRASTLRECVNRGQWVRAEAEFGKWVMAKGRKLPGLVARRAAEVALFSAD